MLCPTNKAEEASRFINLEHTKTLVAANPDFKQLICLPNNQVIINKNIDQVIDIFKEELCDNLQYLVCSRLNIENMQININIVPIVESA